MHVTRQTEARTQTANKAGIWLAFFLALGLHLLLLIVPVTSQKPVPEAHQPMLELQLTAAAQQTQEPPAPVPEPERPAPPTPEQAEVVLEEHTEPLPVAAEAPATRIAGNLPADPGNMDESEKKQLTNTILARQFFTEESAADKLFGKPIAKDSTEIRKEFHYPARQNMLSMLDKPLPDIPFAYTPDLVHFAYEPGVKGDLQRFWDVITPEFGWRTRYGTEVKCILILVVAGCAWK